MPVLRSPCRVRARRAARDRAQVVVVGDLVLDVVLAPATRLVAGSDVPGRVLIRQGGSATSTARWLGRLGVRSSLVCAVGRDSAARSLIAAAGGDRVTVRAVRVSGSHTGRIGVVLEPDGERSFVQDRAAALQLRPDDLRSSWFAGADAVHLPLYSLLDDPLGAAGMAAIRLARDAGALVSIDLASSEPLLALGRRAAVALVREAAPDLLFTNRDEAAAVVGTGREPQLLELAPVAVVKRGGKGVTVLARQPDPDAAGHLRFEVATRTVRTADTTGAGDAFDAGFLAGWLEARRRGLAAATALQRGAVVGNRTALRHLASPPGELAFS
jgi:sugar/nucleoside kinase (ribokinase family)